MPVSKYVRTVRLVILVLAFAFISLLVMPRSRAQNLTSNQKMIKAITYPPARKSDQTDDYHGLKVADPYRWLEDLDSQETKTWVEAENRLTFGYLDEIPARAKIRERLTKLWNYERFGIPFKEGSHYFYSRNSGLQNQNVYYTVTSLTDKPRLLLDPNTLSADGTVALSGLSASHDGKRLAYSLSASGSDWQEWKVRDVETGRDLSDDLKWVKFSGASWTPDGKGFYYSRYDEPKADSLKGTNYFQKVYYHRLGTPQSSTTLMRLTTSSTTMDQSFGFKPTWTRRVARLSLSIRGILSAPTGK